MAAERCRGKHAMSADTMAVLVGLNVGGGFLRPWRRGQQVKFYLPRTRIAPADFLRDYALEAALSLLIVGSLTFWFFSLLH
jgi:hypothetical protein